MLMHFLLRPHIYPNQYVMLGNGLKDIQGDPGGSRGIQGDPGGSRGIQGDPGGFRGFCGGKKSYREVLELADRKAKHHWTARSPCRRQEAPGGPRGSPRGVQGEFVLLRVQKAVEHA